MGSGITSLWETERDTSVGHRRLRDFLHFHHSAPRKLLIHRVFLSFYWNTETRCGWIAPPALLILVVIHIDYVLFVLHYKSNVNHALVFVKQIGKYYFGSKFYAKLTAIFATDSYNKWCWQVAGWKKGGGCSRCFQCDNTFIYYSLCLLCFANVNCLKKGRGLQIDWLEKWDYSISLFLLLFFKHRC